MSETRTQTGEGVLADVVRESPVDAYLVRHHRKLLLVTLLIVAAFLAACWYFRRGDDGPAPGAPSPGYSAAGPAQEARGA